MTRRGSLSGWAGWILNPRGPSIPEDYATSFLRYMAFAEDDPEYEWAAFDFENDPERMVAIREILDAVDPDLTRFKKRGGKIISYFGWADTALNPLRTVAYYEEVGETMGASRHDFVRLFPVSGMFHCAGGQGVGRFDALVDWVEAGVAPETFVAEREENGTVTLSLPLCPYPKVARRDRVALDGTGQGSAERSSVIRLSKLSRCPFSSCSSGTVGGPEPSRIVWLHAPPPSSSLSQRPHPHDHRYGNSNDQYFKRQTHPPVVAEAVASRPHDQGIVFMPNRREKRTGCGYRNAHQERVRVHV
jgi:hypothetical protein